MDHETGKAAASLAVELLTTKNGITYKAYDMLMGLLNRCYMGSTINAIAHVVEFADSKASVDDDDGRRHIEASIVQDLEDL